MRICVIGAGPCGLAALKRLLEAGCRDVVCYDEHTAIGGNWAYTDDPHRASVHECSRTISSRRLSSFVDFPMPESYPDFPTHRQLLAYFTAYAHRFELTPHVRLGSRVEACVPGGDGRWTVRVNGRTETFDHVVVCSGHHRDPVLPTHPGTFTGTILHSSAYKRAEPHRGQRVLVVGAGNSAADVAVDVARLAARTALSVRSGTYIVPKRILGRPVDVVYTRWQRRLPAPLLRLALRGWLRLTVGAWSGYGLPSPTTAPLVKPPTVNSAILNALRDRRVVAVGGIERYDGPTVHFTGGHAEAFDTIVMATGFRVSFPFLPDEVAAVVLPPPQLNLTHPALPNLFFIGLFQPVGCIWRLADKQARIAALRISGRLPHPDHRGPDRPPAGIEVDYRTFERQLRRVSAPFPADQGEVDLV